MIRGGSSEEVEKVMLRSIYPVALAWKPALMSNILRTLLLLPATPIPLPSFLFAFFSHSSIASSALIRWELSSPYPNSEACFHAFGRALHESCRVFD